MRRSRSGESDAVPNSSCSRAAAAIATPGWAETPCSTSITGRLPPEFGPGPGPPAREQASEPGRIEPERRALARAVLTFAALTFAAQEPSAL